MMVGMGAAMGRVRLGWGLWRGIIGLLLTELGSLFKGLMSWLGWVGQGGLVGCIDGSPLWWYYIQVVLFVGWSALLRRSKRGFMNVL
jgi:hypothetical protein